MSAEEPHPVDPSTSNAEPGASVLPESHGPAPAEPALAATRGEPASAAAAANPVATVAAEPVVATAVLASPAPAVASAAPVPVVAPAALLAPAAPLTTAQLVVRAREGSRAWAALSVRKRIAALRPVAKRILERAELIAQTVQREVGKPIEEAVLSEVLPNADLVGYWCEVMEELLEPAPIAMNGTDYPGKSGRIRQDPRGVVALITPWNYPVAIPLRTLIPALLVGNVVLWKPSEVTPESNKLVAALFDGLPPGVLTLIEGGPSAGQELVDAEIDLVVFTGSVKTGKSIAVRCAERLLPCSLELGGKDAAIVLKDANLERSARGVVWGAFTNHGQNCASIERVFVEAPIAERFIKRVVELTAALTPSDLGRMTTLAQLRLAAGHLEGARAAGAEVLAGGSYDEATLAFAPTVLKLTEAQLGLPLMLEESFGPLLPIVVVPDAEAAVAAANRSAFGLTTSVWTKHVRRARKFFTQLKSGVVTINNHAFTAALPGAPWTGTGLSGHGITNSPHALSALVQVRFELEDRSGRPDVWWYPYTPTLRKLVFAMARLRGGAGFFGRIGALFSLLVQAPKRLLGR